VEGGTTREMPEVASASTTSCFHCGQPCENRSLADQDRHFCCTGCLSVYELLKSSRLDGYYSDESTPGARPGPEISTRHAYLDDPLIQSRLLEFHDHEYSRITLSLPQIHCASCVWLLERLFQLRPGILRSEVNFPERRLTILYRHDTVSLRQVVELLARIGYEPDIKLDSLDRTFTRNPNFKLYTRVGIAGFAFANIMLFSLPEYFSGGLTEKSLSLTFRLASLVLATPVLLYSAADYFRSAYLGLREKFVNLDVPLALGIGALYFRSLYDIASGSGPGYLDSFTGLVFFLLIGRLFQRKTFERLSFERDYRSYFPISAVLLDAGRHSTVPITNLKPGDQVVVRNQELIPADGVLISGKANIDYSFVTGESEPQAVDVMQKLYAGGRQVGEGIELEVIRPVSQSYLVSLWSSQHMSKDARQSSVSLANSMGVWFISGTLVAALGALAYWLVRDPHVAPLAFTSVLIVACPCALALSSPFVLGTALRLLGKHKLFVRNPGVVETMSRLDALVFDKTGTLTCAERRAVRFVGEELSGRDLQLAVSLARQSTHPASRAIARNSESVAVLPIVSFAETPGRGIEGTVDGHHVKLGNRSWVGGTAAPSADESAGKEARTSVWLSLDGIVLGEFLITNLFREGLGDTLRELSTKYTLTVLSGDSPKEESHLRQLFGKPVQMLFGKLPHEKLNEVQTMTNSGRQVLMLGDGLNDAGALRVATVGMAVTEDTSSFSPACDAILDADSITNLSRFLAFARRCRHLIYVSFGLSLAYNLVGLTFAATGHLSPLISAILMPISSVSVVLFATLATRVAARREGLS
jgi:P-type Cu+ transporter